MTAKGVRTISCNVHDQGRSYYLNETTIHGVIHQARVISNRKYYKMPCQKDLPMKLSLHSVFCLSSPTQTSFSTHSPFFSRTLLTQSVGARKRLPQSEQAVSYTPSFKAVCAKRLPIAMHRFFSSALISRSLLAPAKWLGP